MSDPQLVIMLDLQPPGWGSLGGGGVLCINVNTCDALIHGMVFSNLIHSWVENSHIFTEFLKIWHIDGMQIANSYQISAILVYWKSQIHNFFFAVNFFCFFFRIRSGIVIDPFWKSHTAHPNHARVSTPPPPPPPQCLVALLSRVFLEWKHIKCGERVWWKRYGKDYPVKNK